MRKLWVLAFKEVKLAFRDVGAIVTMLVTPLVLTLVIGAAFGGSGSAPVSEIPVLVLNKDTGAFSQDLVDFFNLEDVRDLVAPEIVTDEAAARARVERDEVAALVIIPADFSDAVFPLASAVRQRAGIDLFTLTPDATLTLEQQAAIAETFLQVREQPVESGVIEIYASPDWRLSATIVKSIVRQGVEVLNMQVQGITVIMGQLIPAQAAAGGGQFDPSQMEGMQEAFSMGAASTAELPVDLRIVSSSGRTFNWISYSAASMSVLFLMFAVTSGGRTLLSERAIGTLPRLLVSPTPALGILVGKMAGIVLTGLLQMVLLYGATSLIGAYWGSAGATLLTILALVMCASGVGALISAWSRSQGQAGAIGTAVTLVGAAVSGSFFPRAGLPQWVQTLSLITPNAWGIEIFSRLQLGQGLADVWPYLAGVLALTIVYYGVALLGFRRQFD